MLKKKALIMTNSKLNLKANPLPCNNPIKKNNSTNINYMYNLNNSDNLYNIN